MSRKNYSGGVPSSGGGLVRVHRRVPRSVGSLLIWGGAGHATAVARGVRDRQLVRLPLPRRHLPRRPPTRPVISQATVIAVGVSALGRREILGMPVRDSESTDFWTEFLRSLRQRCLNPTRVTRHL
ncbi:transposase [Arachnia propionica]|uniref:transposase n=1 Tax=Arachnia propionica TaxID=1750 RepID=UPI0036F23DB2